MPVSRHDKKKGTIMNYTLEDVNYFMGEALKEAALAFEKNEVPIGAVIVKNGVIVSKGHNTRESEKNALHHAEIKAIDGACKALGGWRLCGCDMFVTVEPCMMCAGAVINSRIERVFYGTADVKAGGFGSVVDLNRYPFNHTPVVIGGIMQKEASLLLSDFFKKLRTQNS